MNREEAIDILRSYLMFDKSSMQIDIALNMAIEALSADTSSDLISRADAILWVKTECNPYGKPTLEFESGKRVIEHLKQMPSADPKTNWIPCSERFPSEDGCYLVSTTGTNNDIIDIAYYTEEIWHKASRIKAWMPLPKPYREDGKV